MERFPSPCKNKFTFCSSTLPIRTYSFKLVSLFTHHSSLKKKTAFTLAEGATRIVLPNSQRRAAFTLAEVLITLGIIGVVAAMTIPSLITKYKAVVLKSELNTAYSLIGQAIEHMRADGMPVNPADYPTPKTFKNNFINYFEIALDCGYGESGSSICILDNYNNIYKDYSRQTRISMGVLNDGQFILKNGMQIFIEDPTSPKLYITVDINSVGKGPNAWGHDLFTFQIINDGKLLPMGAKGTDYYDMEENYCSKTTSSNNNGVACTAKALSENDYFEKLP